MIFHSNKFFRIISQVSAVNKDVNEFGDVSEIIDRTYETGKSCKIIFLY